MFKLHYEELMRKDREISDLQVGAGWGSQGWLGNVSCCVRCSRWVLLRLTGIVWFAPASGRHRNGDCSD